MSSKGPLIHPNAILPQKSRSHCKVREVTLVAASSRSVLGRFRSGCQHGGGQAASGVIDVSVERRIVRDKSATVQHPIPEQGVGGGLLETHRLE